MGPGRRPSKGTNLSGQVSRSWDLEHSVPVTVSVAVSHGRELLEEWILKRPHTREARSLHGVTGVLASGRGDPHQAGGLPAQVGIMAAANLQTADNPPRPPLCQGSGSSSSSAHVRPPGPGRAAEKSSRQNPTIDPPKPERAWPSLQHVTSSRGGTACAPQSSGPEVPLTPQPAFRRNGLGPPAARVPGLRPPQPADSPWGAGGARPPGLRPPAETWTPSACRRCSQGPEHPASSQPAQPSLSLFIMHPSGPSRVRSNLWPQVPS